MNDDEHDDDDGDPLRMPFAGYDSGAAADSADDTNERLTGLPRILRYTLLSHDNANSVELRLSAEIDQRCPDLPSNMAWAAARDTDAGLALAAELDHLAVTRDLPLLRSLGDCVRLLSLSLPFDVRRLKDFRRVTQALIITFDASASGLEEEQRGDLERCIAGWAALPMAIGFTDGDRRRPAISFAARLGDQLARFRIRAAAFNAARRVRREIDAQKESDGELARRTPASARPTATPERAILESVLPHHAVVARIDEAELRTAKLKSFIEPVKHILNVALPQIKTPALDEIRTALIAEFPYATAAIDLVLADLIGRPTVKLRPLLLVGEPGGGKSRFARRLGEVLGLSIWHLDAAQSDGAVFAGTDRRWHSAECCHPLLAIARGKAANPLVLLDEIEKAGTRSDYGRLWDCLLGLLESETSGRYPDPALQIPLDLSHISYVATANSLAPLPAPLRDRFRIVSFPKPSIGDLDALLPGLIKMLATERGLDARWIAPLDVVERVTIAQAWPGGSIRRLQRILEAILLTRDRTASRH